MSKFDYFGFTEIFILEYICCFCQILSTCIVFTQVLNTSAVVFQVLIVRVVLIEIYFYARKIFKITAIVKLKTRPRRANVLVEELGRLFDDYDDDVIRNYWVERQHIPFPSFYRFRRPWLIYTCLAQPVSSLLDIVEIYL